MDGIEVDADDDDRAVRDHFWGLYCVRQPYLHSYVDERYTRESARVIHVRHLRYLHRDIRVLCLVGGNEEAVGGSVSMGCDGTMRAVEGGDGMVGRVR